MKASRILRFIGLIIVAASIIACGEEKSGGRSAPSLPDVSAIVGTYALTGFTVIFDDGTTINQDDPIITSWSGTMKIFSDNNVSQTVTLNGFSSVQSGKITKMTNTQLYLSSAGCSYWVNYSWNDPVFVTTLPTGIACLGNDFSETDTWSRTSTSTKASSVIKSAASYYVDYTNALGAAFGNIPIRY
jgi:hypothetical protein